MLNSLVWLLAIRLFLVFRYRQHVVWTDKELNLKLMRKGLLTRIYAPMVTFALYDHLLLMKGMLKFSKLSYLDRNVLLPLESTSFECNAFVHPLKYPLRFKVPEDTTEETFFWVAEALLAWNLIDYAWMYDRSSYKVCGKLEYLAMHWLRVKSCLRSTSHGMNFCPVSRGLLKKWSHR